MGNIKIQEIAAEAGMSNNDMLLKARYLGFNVKVAGSSISLDEAGILMDYAMTGKLPADFKKSDDKPKKATPPKRKTASKKPKKTSQKTSASQEHSSDKEKEPEKKQKEVQKDRQEIPVNQVATEEKHKSPRPRIGRSGITIIKKAKPAPIKASRNISLNDAKTQVSKKKKSKRPAEAKNVGKKLEILGDRGLGASIELYEEEEVVLLDFSDKNIYEEMKRQEERRKAEAKKREQKQGNMSAAARRFQPQQHRSIRRGGKKKRYVRQEIEERVSAIKIPEDVRVYEFAEKIGKSVGEVVKVLFSLGTMVAKNDFLDKDSIEILADEFEVSVETINPLDTLDYVSFYDEHEDENLEVRPPVITIMGHVDHGKTSLLDRIRSTKVADKEAGGITQHVGAYQIEKDGNKITFVDTPGHSAFTEMRARGAMATDIVIIVVAADDGVMPQTRESISHAKAAGVPMIFAINKIDKESANIDNIKSQLAEMDILAVDWGGEYEFVPVSAHTGEGIDELLETIILQAELMELHADPGRKAKAIVVESSVEKGFGPVANIIVKNGTLSVGDNIIVGTTYGRVRIMILDDGTRTKSIGPSMPAAVVGLQEVPEAGEVMISVDNEKSAKEVADKRRGLARTKYLSKSTKVSIDELGSLIAEGHIKKLPLIVKTDVQGSLEAIKGALADLKNEEVKVEVIHDGVGGITESDISLADASENTIIVGFNVRPAGTVKNKAKELGVEIKSYSVIYNLLDDVKAWMGGLMSPVVSEEITGQAEVRETFVVAKVGTIAGCMVTVGVIERNVGVRLIRDGIVIYTSTISSLKRFNDDVKEVKNGFECGIMIENYNDIKVGDIFETFKEVEENAVL